MKTTVLASLLSGLACASSVGAASGQLDPSFDGDGLLIQGLVTVDQTQNSDRLYAGLIDQAGRYVAVGDAPPSPEAAALIVRRLPTGQLDPSFGDGGVARLPKATGFGDVGLRDVVEQPDGKLVVAGRAADALGLGNPSVARLCRLEADGTLDPDFGDGGCTTPLFDPTSDADSIEALALQDDGRIVAVGLTSPNAGALRSLLARFESDGSFDLCFANTLCQSGGAMIDFEPVGFDSFRPADVAIDSLGRIVVAGVTESGPRDFVAVRVRPIGALDSVGFGNGGARRVAFDQGGNDFDRATALVVRDDDSIVMTGTVEADVGTLAGIAALDAAGTPIATFGDAGKRVYFFDDVSIDHVPSGLIEQADGKLVVAGYVDYFATGASYNDCGIARFSADGDLDPDFASSGVGLIDSSFGTPPQRVDACTDLASDGRRLVLFGYSGEFETISDSLMARIDQDGVFANGFEE